MECGCARYRLGACSLYPPEIRTVYVPVFESQSFRRNLGERLTEAVIKEIEDKTPYKVVASPAADSVLSGTITGDTKRTIVENPLDEQRELETQLSVTVTWVDRRGQPMRDTALLPVPPEMVDLSQSASVIPEVGQSIATSQERAIQRLAEQIVELMEAPW
jgi:hypothetical protein